jgi:hypothetical protein
MEPTFALFTPSPTNITDKGDAGHVATVFEDGDQGEQDQEDGNVV